MTSALKKAIYDAYTEPMQSHINVGAGEDITIRKLAKTIGEVVGYHGRIEFDSTKPDGAPRKLMRSERLYDLSWRPQVTLLDGLLTTYQEFVNEYGQQETTGVKL